MTGETPWPASGPRRRCWEARRRLSRRRGSEDRSPRPATLAWWPPRRPGGTTDGRFPGRVRDRRPGRRSRRATSAGRRARQPACCAGRREASRPPAVARPRRSQPLPPLEPATFSNGDGAVGAASVAARARDAGGCRALPASDAGRWSAIRHYTVGSARCAGRGPRRWAALARCEGRTGRSRRRTRPSYDPASPAGVASARRLAAGRRQLRC